MKAWNSKPKQGNFVAKLLFVFSLLMTFSISTSSYANNINIAYGGVFTAGKESNYPDFLKLKEKIDVNKKVSNLFKKLNKNGKLPFNLLIDRSGDIVKYNENESLFFAIVLTDDSCITEEFIFKDTVKYKNLMSVGLSAIFYQTNGQSPEGRNNIIFSVPITGYQYSIAETKNINENELVELFLETLLKVIEEKLPARLSKLSFVRAEGEVIEVSDVLAKINLGYLDGILENQFMDLYEEGKSIGKGQIIKTDKNESIVTLGGNNLAIKRKAKVAAVAVKGRPVDTYQVIDFKISSKWAKEILHAHRLAPQLAQWITDFMFYNGGKTVLPAKFVFDGITENSGSIFMTFVKDGTPHLFQISKAKNTISFELTCFMAKATRLNNIETEKIYKVWVEVSIPEKGFVKEYEFTAKKIVSDETSEFEEKDVFFEMLLNKIPIEIAEKCKNI